MDTRVESGSPETWIGEGPVLLHFDGAIATLTLNRPAASNGMNIEMMKAIYEAVMHCHRDPRVRVVHLRGAGPNFCAGGDVREFAAKGEALGDFLKEVTSYLQIAVGALIRLDAVVVTEVHGYAAGGGGLGLVCASDIVVAGASARFMAGATRVGMAPDGGASVILARLIGLRRAADLFLTNRIVAADEALSIGLVTEVAGNDDLAEAARRKAESVAKGAPRALAATKRLLWNGVGLSVEACLPEEARTVSELSATADSREGLAAVIGKRKPVFTGA
ncbi:enoyl-CoA hydratase/isomerase family protein [Microbaculum marinum]|uniref:Enoyl-CoA hydratase-related protein n=1 Tax=Microbaculum marinum TaxID=1764581 RepID=A0AAW9RUE9_9HYPH